MDHVLEEEISLSWHHNGKDIVGQLEDPAPVLCMVLCPNNQY